MEIIKFFGMMSLVLLIFCQISVFSAEYINIFRENKSVKKEDRYNNMLSMSSYIKVTIRDKNTNSVENLIIENLIFFNFLRSQNELHHKYQYIKYMTQHDESNRPIDIIRDDLIKFIGIDSFNSKILKKPISLKNLSVDTEQEFLDKYFDAGHSDTYLILKSDYSKDFSNKPEFIALLLNLGYDIILGDAIPVLYIYNKPFIETLK